MSKGSTVVPVRIPDEILEFVDREIVQLNKSRKDEPYDRSSFIRYAISCKLKHIWRSRKHGQWMMAGRRKKGAVQ